MALVIVGCLAILLIGPERRAALLPRLAMTILFCTLFWLVFTGRIRYSFEGQQPFVASEGDIVYVPANTWHATRFFGPDPACRLSITEYVGNTLLLEPRPPR